MAQTYHHVQTSFAGGEISPLLKGNVRSDLYQKGLNFCSNFIVLPQGAVTRRPGTNYISDIVNMAETARLIPFVFAQNDAYLVEVSASNIRFFQDGVMKYALGSSPYTAASDLSSINFVQSADKLYLLHPDYKPQQIVRTAITPTFSVSDFAYENGPYGVQNKDSAITVAQAGTTLTATGGDVWDANDVGTYFRLKDGTGWVDRLITAFTDSKNVTVATSGTVSSTDSWYLSAWSDTRGWPKVATFWEQRLVFAGNSTYPNTLWGSATGDYVNFQPTETDGTFVDSNARTYTIDADEVNSIVWMKSDRVLVVGTLGAEWAIEGAALGSVSYWQAKRMSTYGSAENINPVKVGHAVLFVQEGQRSLREWMYYRENDGYDGLDLNIASSHLTEGKFLRTAWQPNPDSIVWCVMEDGSVKAMSYDRRLELAAWSQHTLGPSSAGAAFVEDVAAIPGADQDDVYFLVKRTINGSTKRYIERLTERTSGDRISAHHVDSATVYSGASTTSITGLSHLEGEEVSIWADGATQDSKTVVSGAITLDTAASDVVVGLPFTSAIETLAPDNTTEPFLTRVLKLTRLFVTVYATTGLKMGVRDVDGAVDDKRQTDLTVWYSPVTSGDTAELKTGKLDLGSYEGDSNHEDRVYLFANDPSPVTILNFGAIATLGA